MNVPSLRLTIDVAGDTAAKIEGQPHTSSSRTPSTCTVAVSGVLCKVEVPNGETAQPSVSLAFASSGCAYPHFTVASNDISITRAAGTTGECYASGTAIYNFLITNAGSGVSSAEIAFTSTP